LIRILVRFQCRVDTDVTYILQWRIPCVLGPCRWNIPVSIIQGIR